VRVVVTGGAGFIGGHLADALVSRGDDVVVVDDLSTGSREHVPEGAELVVQDVAKGLGETFAGADAVQMVSALLHHGPSYVMVMRQSLEQWLEWHKMGSLAEARGRLSHSRTQDPAAYERANYIRTLQSWGKSA